jgi:uncharacterized protein with HEPN domain
MRPNERDLSYLLDMVRCCDDIIEFTETVNYEQFQRDKMRRYATERQLETLGEAANHVSLATQAQLKPIDWSRIVGLRNKLAHDYGEILAQRVWLIAIDSVRKLHAQLLSIEELRAALSDAEKE